MKNNRFMLYVCLLSGLLTSACVPLIVGGALGAAGYAYVKGNVVKNLDGSVTEANEAASSALRELDYFITMDELNIENSRIVAEDPKAKQIEISITALTPRASQIKIRVGWLGNEIQSLEILKTIEEYL